MMPCVALIGQANVGKSTLFNRLTGTRDALVLDQAGVTRDRLYGYGTAETQRYILIDTGGLRFFEDHFESAVTQQAAFAMAEADLIFFVVDAKMGLTPNDLVVSEQLRRTHKPIYLIVNKIDEEAQKSTLSEFYQLGFPDVYPVSAAHKRGFKLLSKALKTYFDHQAADPMDDQQSCSEHDETSSVALAKSDQKGIQVAILGRPNVGKSTLSNRLLGEERVLTSDEAGTTRDKVEVQLDNHGQRYTFIDTAGVRRRSKVSETIEKFSVLKSLQAIQEAHVVLLLLNAREGLVEQDLHILHHILQAGKGFVLVINQWDNLSSDVKKRMKNDLDRRLNFVPFAEQFFISARCGTHVGNLFPAIQRAYHSSMKELSTARVNELLQAAIQENPPPRVAGQLIKLRYAHAGGRNPPLVIVHGRRVGKLPDHYRRYLIGFFRKALQLVGTPIKMIFKEDKH